MPKDNLGTNQEVVWYGDNCATFLFPDSWCLLKTRKQRSIRRLGDYELDLTIFYKCVVTKSDFVLYPVSYCFWCRCHSSHACFYIVFTTVAFVVSYKVLNILIQPCLPMSHTHAGAAFLLLMVSNHGVNQMCVPIWWYTHTNLCSFSYWDNSLTPIHLYRYKLTIIFVSLH